MQSAGGWDTDCGTNINIEIYRESAQRHCGQVEQGIMNVEGK